MHDIYFTSESKSNIKEKTKIWDIRQVRSKLGNQACKRILVAHALLGCATTSRIFGINKAVAFTKLKSEEAFGKYADVFLCPTSNQQLIIEEGEKLLLLVSGAKDEKTLDELRLFKFSQKIVTSTVAVQPESLGPTSNAASFHSLRVYFQIQVWLGRSDMNPLDWGWVQKGDHLFPISMSKPAAPDGLLKVIRCSCKTDCRARCTCYKYNLRCTSMCKNCRGVPCLNCQHVEESDEMSTIEED